MELLNDEFFMARALAEAAAAFEAGEVPVGAVAVRGNQVIARAGNQVETLKDATAHAEILALTQAAAALGDWRICGNALIVSDNENGDFADTKMTVEDVAKAIRFFGTEENLPEPMIHVIAF